MSKNGTAAGSQLEWLRARHAALSADRYLDMEVPGYSGRLVVRYGPAPWAVIARVQTLVAKEDRDGRNLLMAQTDVLIAACRDVLMDGETIGDGPRRFDAELAGVFGAETSSAREVVALVYPSELAVAVACGELLDWTQNAQAEATEEFVGE